jgi:Sulfotransferase domain
LARILTHVDFVPRPDDIFIVTYPRSGTTWMQMILYQLTTDGNMDFPHIYEYCPWFEQSSRSAGGFEGRPSPRLFKSHLTYRQIPKGPCKYIYVARDGKDAAVSYFHLYKSLNGYEGRFAEFFDLFLGGKLDGVSWFAHVKGWWRHRHDPNVLFLRYEDLLADLEGCLRKIIAFGGFDIPPERLPTILERCSFAFMKQHESQFDPLTGQLWEQGAQPNAFLRQGRSGEGQERLSPRQAARFERVFQQQLASTGFDFSPNGRKPV